MNPGHIRQVQEKWARYIIKVRRNHLGAEAATTIGGAQNLTATRYRRISAKVDIYLRDNRLATDNELNAFTHPEDEEVDDDDASVDE